ncbi:hypothetical protein KQ236_13030, partial [Lactococcus lactis]|nr:hypothetical protein [Lactococcus lactis]
FERVNKDELIEKEMLKIRQEHANAGYRPMSELLKQRGYHTHHCLEQFFHSQRDQFRNRIRPLI